MKEQSNSNLRMGMTLMLMIFFIFGFITNFNIALKDQVQATFHLSNFMANLVNGVFFFAYFVFSFICGKIIKKTGYKMGLIIGLLLISIDSFCYLFNETAGNNCWRGSCWQKEHLETYPCITGSPGNFLLCRC